MYLSKAITARMNTSTWTKAMKKKHCTIQPGYEMVLISATKFSSVFGVTLEENHTSAKDKWLRKKYMGLLSWGLILINRIMPMFAISVTM